LDLGAAVARKTKTVSKKNKVKPGRAPLVAALEKIRAKKLSTFSRAEALYLKAMEEFDELVVTGVADQGDRQNGKGDFFNDVLAQLLANCSEKELHSRPDVPGLSFDNHKLDVAYPATGEVSLVVETKATGSPKHDGNEKQKNPDGRPGSADLEKRVKEASFKNIDIKAQQARVAGKGGGATSDLESWMSQAPPRCYMFLAVRVVDDKDLERAIRYGHTAAHWFDACGLYCYGWDDARSAYEAKPINDPNLRLDRVLSRVCTALRTMP
jgi:hypothetical protein